MAHPHPEPRTYPMMLRTWDYRWWKPVVGILMLAVGMLLVMPLLLLPVLAVAVALEGGSGTYGDQFAAALTLDSVTPASMLYLNLTLASLTLVCMFIVRFVHRLRPRWLSSVLPGMRWKFFFICFGLAIVALIASVAVSNFLPSNPNDLSGEPNKLTGTLVATGIVILLTTPLQAIGEEYAFRGYLMQAFGSLTRSRIVALVVTSVLFAFAHGAQNFPLFFDRLAFGLMAGLVVILVGGLEAGIALAHPEQPAGLRRGDLLRRPAGCAHGLRGVLVAAAGDHRAERRLPGAGAARRAPDGAVLEDDSAGAPDADQSADQHAGGPSDWHPSGASTSRRDDPAPIGGRRGVCVFSTVGPPRSTTAETVTGSHGVWGNWQPDWFWSS